MNSDNRGSRRLEWDNVVGLLKNPLIVECKASFKVAARGNSALYLILNVIQSAFAKYFGTLDFYLNFPYNIEYIYLF